MTDERPTAARPLHIGPHRLYLYRDEVPVIVYRGDVAPAEIVTIVDFISRIGPVRAVAVDVSELGSFGMATRKALTRNRRESNALIPETILYICGADVVRRALMTLAATATRVVSKHRIAVHHHVSLDAALVDVDALLDRA